eukprot:1841050-Pyramimonas_sp.AAC.1
MSRPRAAPVTSERRRATGRSRTPVSGRNEGCGDRGGFSRGREEAPGGAQAREALSGVAAPGCCPPF